MADRPALRRSRSLGDDMFAVRRQDMHKRLQRKKEKIRRYEERLDSALTALDSVQRENQGLRKDLVKSKAELELAEQRALLAGFPHDALEGTSHGGPGALGLLSRSYKRDGSNVTDFQLLIRLRNDPQKPVELGEQLAQINHSLLVPAKTPNSEVSDAVRSILLSDHPRSILFAYGQSGSGKSYTLYTDEHSIIPHTIIGLLEKTMDAADIKVTIICGQEITNTAYDVLADEASIRRNQKHKEWGKQLSKVYREQESVPLHSVAQFRELLALIDVRRFTLETERNPVSSRGHLAFTLQLKQKEETIKQVTFVDLCGTEETPKHIQGRPSNASNQPQHQTKSINDTLYDVREFIRDVNAKKLLRVEDLEQRFKSSAMMSILLRDRIYGGDGAIEGLTGTVLMCLDPGEQNQFPAHAAKSLNFAREVFGKDVGTARQS